MNGVQSVQCYEYLKQDLVDRAYDFSQKIFFITCCSLVCGSTDAYMQDLIEFIGHLEQSGFRKQGLFQMS